MNLDHMLAQLRGTLPSNILEPDTLPDDWPTCSLCGATHKTHYVARVVMWSGGCRSLI